MEQYVFISGNDMDDVDSAIESYLQSNPNHSNYQHFHFGDTRVLRLLTDLPGWMHQHLSKKHQEPIYNPGDRSDYTSSEKEMLRQGMLFIINGTRLLNEANTNAQMRSTKGG